MKKSLIALAVLAASGAAMAQSSVTLSGIIKGGFASTKYSERYNWTGQVDGTGEALMDGASSFIISGKEDLGGGMSAVFQIQQHFRLDQTPGSRQADGNTFVGLNTSFGGFKLGKLDTHYCYGRDEHEDRATAYQASNCALLGYVSIAAPHDTQPNTFIYANPAIANAERSTNAIRYELPNLGGLTGNVTYSTGWQQGSSEGVGSAGKGDALAAQLTYNVGPVQVGGSIWNGRTEDRSAGEAKADQSAFTLAGKFNFGMGTVGLTYDESEITVGTFGTPGESDLKRAAWSVPVTVKLGAGTVLFTYTKADSTKINGNKSLNTGAELITVGYDYSLSKRTSLGVSYAELKNKQFGSYSLYGAERFGGLPAAEIGQKQQQFYVGVRHAF